MQQRNRQCLLVTGGAGFIGSAFIRYGLTTPHLCKKIVNLDLLTYASDLRSLAVIENDSRYCFIQGDVCNAALVEEVCQMHEIDTILHFAAESHVDRSIAAPEAFFETNVRGTFTLLEVVRKLPRLHFYHISTDEVYGSLGETGSFSETSPYAPNSPYAASKAAADHFVRAYAHTYGISTTMSHCTNNYGPFQCKEKLIPRIIDCCLGKKALPIYGNGKNVRDWLYVDDHVEALWCILQKAKAGTVYDISGNSEKRNLDLIAMILKLLSEELKEDPVEFQKLITFVADRPGHDFRYAVDASKLRTELGWIPKHSLEEGLRKTIKFYTGDIYAWR